MNRIESTTKAAIVAAVARALDIHPGGIESDAEFKSVTAHIQRDKNTGFIHASAVAVFHLRNFACVKAEESIETRKHDDFDKK